MSKKMTVADVLRVLEERAPSGTAETWDNVGLLAGDPSWPTAGAIVTIDLTQKAIQEAKSRGYRLIINHHPCIFPKSKGLSRVVSGPGKSGLVFEAIREGIAVAAYHTNFDRCALEVAYTISEGLGLTPRGRLLEKAQGAWVKLVVFVPVTHAEKVRDAIVQAGAGHIGNYDCCTFSTPGEGTFRGKDGTNPYLGKSGRLETVQEVKLETVLPRGIEKSVIQAMRGAHPYEEVAYDLIPVEQVPGTVGLIKGLGYGFWGEFPQPKAFAEVVRDVKTLFKVDGFLLTEPAPRRIQRLAFAAGKGASVAEAAAAVGCDLLITGEAGYHEALAVSVYRQAGVSPSSAARAPKGSMAVMELGHRESERFFVETVKSWLSAVGFKAVGFHVRTQKIWSS